MSYHEFIVSACHAVLGMSFESKEALREVKGMSKPIRTTVGCIMLYPSDITRHHWCGELSSYVVDLQDKILNIKTKKGLLKRSQVWELLYKEPLTPEDRGQKLLIKRCRLHMQGLNPTGSIQNIEIVYHKLVDMILDINSEPSAINLSSMIEKIQST